MECIPAIDLRAGQAVRLVQGDFANETGYGDPVALAHHYAEAGAGTIHVVDLDAARGAPDANRAVVAAIVAAVGSSVQVGGGIRSEAIAEVLFDLGVARIVLGTAGVEDPALLARLARRFPGRVLLGLDHRRTDRGAREVALRGWEQASGRELFELLGSVASLGLGGVVVTDIARDGMLSGPDLEGYKEILEASAVPLVASGGVAGLEDLRALRELRANGRALAGVIVGKALLSGAMTIEEALAACAP